MLTPAPGFTATAFPPLASLATSAPFWYATMAVPSQVAAVCVHSFAVRPPPAIRVVVSWPSSVFRRKRNV